MNTLRLVAAAGFKRLALDVTVYLKTIMISLFYSLAAKNTALKNTKHIIASWVILVSFIIWIYMNSRNIVEPINSPIREAAN